MEGNLGQKQIWIFLILRSLPEYFHQRSFARMASFLPYIHFHTHFANEHTDERQDEMRSLLANWIPHSRVQNNRKVKRKNQNGKSFCGFCFFCIFLTRNKRTVLFWWKTLEANGVPSAHFPMLYISTCAFTQFLILFCYFFSVCQIPLNECEIDKVQREPATNSHVRSFSDVVKSILWQCQENIPSLFVAVRFYRNNHDKKEMLALHACRRFWTKKIAWRDS